MNKNALGIPILISLVIGNMIGTGIFILPASLANYGTISLLSWVYTSLGALFLGITFTLLNKRFPKTGGPYVFCKEAFGRPTGFTIAYIYWLSYLISIAGIAVSSISYLGYLAPQFNAVNPLYNKNLVLGVELFVVWLFTLINIFGIRTAGLVQLFMTIVKLVPLFLITLLGFGKIDWHNLTLQAGATGNTWHALSSAAAMTFWAFIGLEAATVPAENTHGARDIFIATIAGTLITSLIYIASTFVLMGMIPVDQLKNTQFPFAAAATILFGSKAAAAIALCAVISGLGALNVCVLIQGQIVFAAARDHLFPRSFAKLSRHDVPVSAQLLSSGLISFLLISTTAPSLLKQFDNIALLASLLTLITYFTATLAEIKFLLKEKRSLFHVVLSKSFMIALLAALYSAWMISSIELTIILIGVLMIAACIPIYFFTVRKYEEIR
jgi:basic amino acid/polyamine antiporter, APA family